MAEWLTIRQFAEQAHVSRQAVYQRIKSLEQYTNQVVNESGKFTTLISSDALPLFVKGNSSQTSQVVSQENQDRDKLIDVLTAEVERLRADNDRLIAEKAALSEALREKDQTISAYGLRFADLAAQNAQLADQAQRLHAADKPRLIAANGAGPDDQSGDASPEAPETPSEGPADEQVQEHGQEEERPAEGQPEGQKRRGFFAWLLGE